MVAREFGGSIIASDFGDTRCDGGFGLRADLRQLPLADGCADLVICLHVLEHIAEFEACLIQIERILKPAGVAWLQVPYEPGQAKSVRLESSPLHVHGHEWRFGMDMKTLLGRPSWEVAEYLVSERWSSREVEQYALNPPERFWVAHKRS
jgi:ubiquinone/menaquinone biosynthesis C-methylase UbiE